MRRVYQIDTSGKYLTDVILNDSETTPSDCIDVSPPQGLYILKWNGSQWVEGMSDVDLLNMFKSQKIAELKQSFGSTLFQGFTSTADETSRVYGFSADDSTHWDWIRGMTSAPNCPSTIPVKDINGSRLSLSIPQAQQLCLDAQTFYLNTYTHWDGREQDVENATTTDAVNAIVW